MPNPSSKVDILGLSVNRLDTDTVVKAIVKRAKSNKPAGFVVRPHVEFIERALNDPDIMKLLNQSEFCLVDGVALQWAAYYLSKRRKLISLTTSLATIPLRPSKLQTVIAERIAGTTFTLKLLRECANKNATVFLIGNPQKKSIEFTANWLKTHIKGLSVIGSYSARRMDKKRVTLSGKQAKELQKLLSQTQPDVILIGLGFPRQEQVMANLSAKLAHGLFIGEGGTFDYREFGGHIRRAPKVLRQTGLEWLWRLIRQPSRIKRQVVIPKFIWRVHRWPR